MRVLIFGDSVAQGFWDLSGGWAQRLRTYYDEQKLRNMTRKHTTVFGLGVDGDTTAGLVKRVGAEINARLWPNDPMIVVIAVGLNDSMIAKGEPISRPELFSGELKQVISIVRQYTEKVLIVGMNACDETQTRPVAWGDYTYTNERIWEFEQALRKFCETNSLPIVRIYEKFQGKRIEENLLSDGIHPNEAGHQLIADEVRQQLDKLITEQPIK